MAYHSANNPDQLPAFPEPEKDKPNQPQPQHHKSPTPQQQQFRPQQPQSYHQQSYQQQPYRPPPPQQQQQQQWRNEPLPPRHHETQHRPQDARPLDHRDNYGGHGHRSSSLSNDPRNAGYAAAPRSPAPQQKNEGPLSDDAVQSLFYDLDVDTRGYITEKNLAGSLVNGDSRGSKFNPVTVKMMVRMFDSNRNGELELAEFVGMWRFLEKWQDIFKGFDKDQSGTISLPEFKVAIAAFQYRLSDSFIDFIFRMYDTKNDGVLTFDIFMQACITLKRMTDIFKKYDDDRDGYINISFEDFVSEFLRQLQRMVSLNESF